MCQTGAKSSTDELGFASKNEMASKSLRESIEEDNAAFKRLIDTIPAKNYFDSDTRELLKEKRNKNMDQKVEEIEKRLKTTLEWTEKAKLKRARFDPAENQTISSLQERLETETEAEEKQPKKKKKKQKDGDNDELKSSTSSMEDLKARLQEKIKALQAKRKDFATYDRKERIQLKRRQNRVKKKLKAKSQKNHEHKNQNNEAGDGPATAKQAATPGKPIFNKEGKMVFSKFDFSDIGDESKKNKRGNCKDFKKLLKKAESDKTQVEALASVDASKAKKLKEKQKWEKAIQKAEGVKVRDDPELLKKAIKRKDKKKQKSETSWDDRKKDVEEKMKRKQEKRKRNIKKKKDSTIKTKISKAKKKGRVIPGF